MIKKIRDGLLSKVTNGQNGGDEQVCHLPKADKRILFSRTAY